MDNIQTGELYLHDTIRPLLDKYNFSWNQENSYYFRNKGNYRQSIRISLRNGAVVNGNNRVQKLPQLNLQVGVRDKMVEDLVGQFRKFYPVEGAQTACFTAQQPIATLSQTELGQLSRQLENMLENRALPLLERFSSVKRLDALFNRNTYQQNKQLGGLLNRCFKGLVLARFSHRRRTDDLYKQYLNRLDNQWAPRNTIENFTKLYNFLKVYQLN